MSRDFQMLVFGDGGGLPLIVYPTSFGNFHQCNDFQLTDACADFVERGRITLYCPDAIDLDSFYNKSIHPADRIKTHMAYENVVLHDVIDFARREAACQRVAVTGASLGAYHAANLAFRHPDAVSQLISMSGAFDISDFSAATMMTTSISTAPTNTCRTCLTRGNSTICGSSSAPANGIIPGTKVSA